MKTIQIFLVLAFSALAFAGQAQKTVTDTLWVNGVCGMCKDRIELAMDTKGVIAANYELHDKLLVVTYNPKKVRVEDLHSKLNEVGHDTKLSKASDAAYDNIHGCCKYRTSTGESNCSGEDEH